MSNQNKTTVTKESCIRRFFGMFKESALELKSTRNLVLCAMMAALAIVLRIAGRNHRHDVVSLHNQDGVILEPSLGVVVEEPSRLQEGSVHAVFQHQLIPGALIFVFVLYNF